MKICSAWKKCSSVSSEKNSFNPVGQFLGPQIEQIPRGHALIVRNEIQIDEAVQHPLAAAEVQPQRTPFCGQGIAVPKVVAGEPVVFPPEARKRESPERFPARRRAHE
jgi:hypothetical protein